VKAGDTGRLFGSVTPADIAGAIKSAGGPLVEKRSIAIDSPIKTTGKHQVSVQLHPEVAATVRLEVAAN
jgi:large subunit ribosomal protein L9